MAISLAAKPTLGLRYMSDGLRTAERLAMTYEGLPEKGTKNELLRFLESIPASFVGVNSASWRFLHHLVKRQPKAAFLTKDEMAAQDQISGLDLISSFSDTDLAAELHVSVRTLSTYRRQLSEAGLIAFRDSPSRARWYAKRNGKTVEAYGIDLRPLLARYNELRQMMIEAKQQTKDLVAAKRHAARTRNRIRALLPFISDADHINEADALLKELVSVKNRNDLSFTKETTLKALDLIGRLESLVDQTVEEAPLRKLASCRPEAGTIQIPPTSSPEVQKEVESLKEGSLRHLDATVAPSPIRSFDDERGHTDVFNEISDDDEAAEGTVLWEFTPKKTTYRPFAFMPSKQDPVQTPSLKLALDGLAKVMLPAKGWYFERLAMFPTDSELFVAYGVASATRLGVSKAEIQTLKALHGEAFACAALISEFRPSVFSRLNHFRAIMAKLNSADEPVDLKRSWTATIRELHGKAREVEPSFASRRVN